MTNAVTAAPSWDEIAELCQAALTKAGYSPEAATALTESTLDAERRGKSIVGLVHLFDYLAGAAEGRINVQAQPHIESVRSALIRADADRGLAQHAYALARPKLIDAARHAGIALLGISGSYTSGELGYYSTDLASEGFVVLAGTNSPPLMSIFGAPIKVTGTNPFTFAIPGSPVPRLVDQASSEIAWVSIRDAAMRGEAIPEGWAIDPDGNPTTDAEAALAGALLPFGGVKGANVAVVIELMAALVGGNFSLDAPSHAEGSESPQVGTWIIAVDAEAFDPGFVARADAHFARLSEFIGHDFGRRRPYLTSPQVSEDVLTRLRDAAA